MSETRCHEVPHDRDDPATRREVSVLSLGAMLMGSRTDEATSFAILDRYVEAGGTFIDTSGNYAFWVNGTQGGESEEPLAAPARIAPPLRRAGPGLDSARSPACPMSLARHGTLARRTEPVPALATATAAMEHCCRYNGTDVPSMPPGRGSGEPRPRPHTGPDRKAEGDMRQGPNWPRSQARGSVAAGV